MKRAYIKELFWHMMHRPDAVAFTLHEGVLTFGELYTQAQEYATGLREATHVQPGDRVMCRMQTGFEMMVALVGHYLLGVIHVPVNTRYGALETAHMCEDSGANVLIIDDEPGVAMLAELAHMGALDEVSAVVIPQLFGAGLEGLSCAVHRIEQLIADGKQSTATHPTPERLDAEQIAMCIYTSGTTGKSKGVMLSYRAVVSGIEALTTRWQFSEQDRVVLALPLFHVHGLGIGVHGTLLKGCEGVLQRGFDVGAVVHAFAHDGATVFMGVPTMYTRLVRHVEQDAHAALMLSKGRLFTSGSAALSADLFARFELVTGHRILERYGMSETLLTISNPYEPARRKPGTIGFPIASCQAQIRDEQGAPCEPGGEVGELVVRGDSLMSGYWRNPDATEASMTSDGWFMTGDAARYDEQGYVVHVGRRSVDILKVGGYKISAREIEEVLMQHTLIAEVAVVGIPDEEWGEQIVAAVVLEPGVAWDEGVVMESLEGKLARFKFPRRMVVIPQIPRNALGKVQKHRVKSLIE